MITTRLKYAIAAMAFGCAILSTSCSIGPNDLPLSGGSGTGYEVTLQFASVLNLPTGAYVMMDGLRVGEVKSVEVTGDAVAVSVNLKTGTEVPADAHAVIRQDTLLGDTYIALDRSRSASDATDLAPGGSIPVDHTISPPQLEDTIAVLANFVNGGTIQKIEDVIGRLNGVVPAQQDLQKLASVVAGDMHDLADNTSEIDRMLVGFDSTAVAVNEEGGVINTVFDDSAMYYWHEAAVHIVSYVSLVLPSIGSIFEGGMWMVPMLDSLADTVSSGRETWDGAVPATEKLATFLRTTVVPFAQNPSVNIRSVESANGDELVGDMTNVLRMLGAVR